MARKFSELEAKMSPESRARAEARYQEMRRLIPNDKTIKAIKAARRGELITVGKLDRLLIDLNDGEG